MAKNGAKTRDSTAISLMRMLSDGPDVSFNGSPMVSPITAALCGSDPLGPRDLACSEAPACFQKNKFRAYSHYKPGVHHAHQITSKAHSIYTSIYFLALSHAPPVLDAEMAI